MIAAALLLALGGTHAHAQLRPPTPPQAPEAPVGPASREVVSKEIDVSRRVAALRLEFADQGELELELSDGSVTLNGDEIGDYQPGEALDIAWRALLGQAVTLEDGPLAQRLRDWTPPADVSAGESALAARMDGALEAALADAVGPGFARSLAGSAGPQPQAGEALVELLDRPEQLLDLARAIQGLDLDDVEVYVGEDHTVAAGETRDGSVVVVDGDLDVDGELDGDAVVVGGTLRLSEGGRITGDVRLVDARVFPNRGDVLGDVSNLDDDPDGAGARPTDQRERLRDQIRDEIEAELDDDRGRGFSPVRSVGDAIGDLIEVGFVILLVGVLGGGLAIHFAREELDLVAEAARSNPVRAGMVGLAGAFLVVPAWALGAVALIITIVGILAVPFWVVLFPIAVVLAAGLGYLAVAQQLGEWVARQRLPKLEWVRLANPYSTMIAGVGALMLAFVVARLLGAFGLVGFVSGLLTVLGVLATVAAALVGFGAVLLTRGGRRSAYAGGGVYWGDDWDDDLGFGRPASPPPPPPPPAGAAVEDELR